MTARHIVPAFATLLLAAVAPAQIGSFTFTGKVEKLDKPPTCSPQATHRIGCTDIYLKAAKDFDLSKWEGQVADMKGGLALALCPTFEVKEAAAARYALRISPFLLGKYRIGERVLIRQTAPLLSLVPLLLATKPGFLPAGPLGVLQLDLGATGWYRNDVALLGFTLNVFDIPNDKRLVGVTIYGQGAYIGLVQNQIEARLLNADCFRIIDR